MMVFIAALAFSISKGQSGSFDLIRESFEQQFRIARKTSSPRGTSDTVIVKSAALHRIEGFGDHLVVSSRCPPGRA